MVALGELEIKGGSMMLLILAGLILFFSLEKMLNGMKIDIMGDNLFNLKIFCVLFLLNLFGLFGGVSLITSWPLFIIFLSVSFWGSVIFFSLSSNFFSLISHFTPENLPPVAGVPMTLIEIMGFLMRPLTLGMRLSANIAGGHLIVELLEEMGSGMKSFLAIHLYESFVSFMQAFIFSLLLLNYFKESK